MPHVWNPPALTATKESPPDTCTGVRLCVIVGPAPSSPNWPNPQQYAAPDVVTPHVWPLPALTAAKVGPPETVTAAVLHAASFVTPSPPRNWALSAGQ